MMNLVPLKCRRFGFSLLSLLVVSVAFLTMLIHPITTSMTCLAFAPPSVVMYPLQQAPSTPSRRNERLSFLSMARYQFDFEEDFYFVLNVTRDASKSEIKQQYRTLARDWHPDAFVEELKFDPDSLSVSQLKNFLKQERVGISTLVEKSELVQKAWDTHRRTQNINDELQERRMETQDRFALLNEAYQTLYDDELRRNYNLSGDWGIPGLSGKRKKGKKGDMGDREEAARVRERAEAAQRSPLQEKVYKRYMEEKAEREAKEEEASRIREEKRAREKEERRKERERLGLKPEEEMTEEEIREANQEKIKAMWGNIFSNMFGGVKLGRKEEPTTATSNSDKQTTSEN